MDIKSMSNKELLDAFAQACVTVMFTTERDEIFFKSLMEEILRRMDKEKG